MSISMKTRNEAYNRMQLKMCEQLDGDLDKLFKLPEEQRNKFIYSLIMSLATSRREPQMDYHSVMLDVQAYMLALEFLGTLTPIGFERIFPIIKEYDGERWGMKDYFSCKRNLNLLPQDEAITKSREMFDFLWDYYNNTIRFLLVNYMQVMDDLQMSQGKASIMEEFLSENDIPVYRKFIGTNGKEYLQNSRAGEIQPIQKSLPSYLRVVK